MTSECLQSTEWKKLDRNMNNKLHTLCSYMAMFPPTLPHYFIKRYSKEGDVVLDPFSGRGTTVLEACFLKRFGIGNDMNPLAYILTKAKANVPHKGRIINRIKKLEIKFNSKLIDVNHIDPNIRMIFSDHTLKQLEFLKNSLNWNKSKVDNFITAMVLGIIHGNSDTYLSVGMPNTFSMSPNYVRNYIHKHKLLKPDRNVFQVLIRKLDRCYQYPPKSGKAFRQDVRKMSKSKDNSVDLIVTSPPYTRVIRYGKFNWIRLWFLDKDVEKVDRKLFFSQSLPKYVDFMKEVLSEMQRVLKINGTAVFVIGDVKSRTSDKVENLAKLVWDKCARPLGLKLVEPIIEDIIRDETKVTKIWGDRKGMATKIDRILILKKTTANHSS